MATDAAIRAAANQRRRVTAAAPTTSAPVAGGPPAPAVPAAAPAAPAPRETKRATPYRLAVPVPASNAAHSAAGFLLGVIVWGWLVMPFLEGGPAQVRKVLLAKFTNRTPSGTWLP